MKQFFKMFFASFLAMVVLGVVVIGLIVGMIAGLAGGASSDDSRNVADNSVLQIEIDRQIHEIGESNPLAAFSGESSYAPGLYDILKAIEYAKTDPKIKGIFIRMSGTPNGWATLEQLRLALADFKTSNKFIYAYGEDLPQKSLFLASPADSIFVNPVGFVELNGLSSQIPFFKNTLQKLEIEPEIFYAGKFKSATEPFRADKISEPNRQQIEDLQSNIWNVFTAALASRSKTSPEAIHSLAVSGAIQFPEDAYRNKIVDGVEYLDQVEDRMRQKTGKKEDEKIEYVDLGDYAGKVRGKRKMNDSRIAVLFAEGSINDGKGSGDYVIASEDMAETIRKIRKNDKIKAVVLRVNSPGGSALASEIILRELQLLKKKKPLIVSMGDLAASGGYYIACQADSIFAMPNTITGSIGVFTMLFNSEKLLKNKLGITFDQVKNAPYADFPTVTRPLTPAEGQKMQASVDTIYHTFKSRVAAGRRLQDALVDSIAQGRVWSGTEALKIGLVDGIGGLDRAVASAAAKAGLKDYQVTTYPEPVDRFEVMIRRFKGAGVNAVNMKEILEQELGADYNLIRQIKILKTINGKAQMLMPFSMETK